MSVAFSVFSVMQCSGWQRIPQLDSSALLDISVRPKSLMQEQAEREMRLAAFMDGLTLGRLERARYEADFPVAPSPDDEYATGWPYSDEDERG